MQPKSFALLTFLLGAAIAAPVAESPSESIGPVPSESLSGVRSAFSGTASGVPYFPAPSGFPTQLTRHPSGGPPAPTGSFPVPSRSFSLPPPFSGTPPRPSGSFTGPHPSWTAVPPS
ncbi:unnamed protein product [Rhizoctonia solani]|uniref:Uncharacterized protein n=1 Tax=Rhizoctonia solani TaxID=456999 RepID=A0A8H3B307_9AGAM|nr:unnamed protein product [Rhizoctonia solani]